MTISSPQRLLLIALFAAVFAAACSKDSVVSSIGMPGSRFSAKIGELTERGSYLDARVQASGWDYRFFFPNTEECKRVLTAEAPLFVWLGVAGRVRTEEERCNVIGILSLSEWRDRGPRRTREPIARRQASFRVIYRDDDMVLARGRFPLSGAVGWGGGGDTVGVIPNDESCAPVIEAGVGSMEFRPRGDALTLLGRRQRCVMLGLAQPR